MDRPSMGTQRQELRQETKKTFQGLSSKQITEQPPQSANESSKPADPMEAMMQQEMNSYDFMLNIHQKNCEHKKNEVCNHHKQPMDKQAVIDNLKRQLHEQQAKEESEED